MISYENTVNNEEQPDEYLCIRKALYTNVLTSYLTALPNVSANAPLFFFECSAPEHTLYRNKDSRAIERINLMAAGGGVESGIG